MNNEEQYLMVIACADCRRISANEVAKEQGEVKSSCGLIQRLLRKFGKK